MGTDPASSGEPPWEDGQPRPVRFDGAVAPPAEAKRTRRLGAVPIKRRFELFRKIGSEVRLVLRTICGKSFVFSDRWKQFDIQRVPNWYQGTKRTKLRPIISISVELHDPHDLQVWCVKTRIKTSSIHGDVVDQMDISGMDETTRCSLVPENFALVNSST